MAGEKRKSRRKPICADGFLYALEGRQIGECHVKDISEGGAMLVRSSADELPSRFVLAFSRNGRVRRHCQIVWQAANHIGVRFTGTGTA
ncbi:MAG TPA: PilZ domain-containing protein [Xanthobacteraceae bacterium]|nr:PilZ domain-containing protein [Xanthobacteraceae bacterium]